MSNAPLVNFILWDERWKTLDADLQKHAEIALAAATALLEKDCSDKEVSLVLMDDDQIQTFNKKFRNYDKPTNVLSFPSEEKEELGDILLAYETVEKEALQASLSPLHHTLHLIIHGFLHLLGYDHEEEQEAQIMESLEIQILKSLNIANPYEDR